VDPARATAAGGDGLRAQPDEPALDEAVATILLGRLADRFDPGAVGDRLAWARLWEPVVMAGPAGRYGLRPDQPAEPWRTWRMSPARVRDVNRRFGPLDWRTPEAHAIYWATEALRKAGGDAQRPIATRLRYQALWAAFQGGRMMLVPETGRLELLPDSRLIAPLEQEMARLSELLPDDGELLIARANMAGDAVLVLYLEGHEAAAAERLHATAANLPAGAPAPDLGTAVLAAAGWEPGLESAAAAELVASWLQAAVRLREVGAADLARGWERVARLACDRFGEQLPPFETLLQQAVSEAE